MSIRATTKREVLQRAVILLENSNALYRSRVYVMAGSILPSNIKDQDLLTVSFAGGTFSYAEQAGAGQFCVPYQGTMRVSLWHTCRTDRNGTDKDALLADQNGLFSLETNILRSLLGSLLPGPTDAFDPILTQCIYAVSDTEASRNDGVFGQTGTGDMAKAILTVDFGVDFYWDMTQEANR